MCYSASIRKTCGSVNELRIGDPGFWSWRNMDIPLSHPVNRPVLPRQKHLIGTRGKDTWSIKMTAQMHILSAIKIRSSLNDAQVKRFTYNRTARNDNMKWSWQHTGRPLEFIVYGKAMKRLDNGLRWKTAYIKNGSHAEFAQHTLQANHALLTMYLCQKDKFVI
jgi:hypothetical protein